MVLTEGTEVWGGNYWITPASATGSKAQLVVDLGCEKTVNGFYVRNTHNGKRRNRAMNEFIIFTSSTSSGPWDEVLRESLEDATQAEIEMTVFFPLPIIFYYMTVRYVMVQVDSYYGYSGGLQYFSENEADKEGATYSGIR